MKKQTPRISKIQLVVTETDIEKGRKRSTVNCPIAIALERVLPRSWRVHVGLKTIRFEDDQRISQIAMMPTVVHDFRSRFDGDMPVEPFEAELTLAAPTDD